jgi:biotin operon repressor
MNPSLSAQLPGQGQALSTTPEVRVPAPSFWSRTQSEHMAALVRLLSTRYKGRANGVHAKLLAQQLGISERNLRALVTAAREDGMAITATPQSGYYFAETADEVEECCAFLRSRSMKSLRLEAQLKRIPLPDLIGQLRLPT